MLLRFEAHLNGVSFAHIDPALMLIDIDERPPQENREEARRALHPGTRISGRVRRSLSVQLRFVVREYDIAARARVLDKIAQWVGDGGWLTINSRPGQRLYVTPDELPAMGSSLKWTGEMTMTLTAYERPYWEQQHPTVAVITSIGTITPLGTMPDVYVECDVVNEGDADMTVVGVQCGDTRMEFSGLVIPAGERLTIAYTDRDVMTITAAGVSALPNRTAESSDDLIARAKQQNTIIVVADQSVTATFTARGRFR